MNSGSLKDSEVFRRRIESSKNIGSLSADDFAFLAEMNFEDIEAFFSSFKPLSDVSERPTYQQGTYSGIGLSADDIAFSFTLWVHLKVCQLLRGSDGWEKGLEQELNAIEPSIRIAEGFDLNLFRKKIFFIGQKN